MLLHCGKTAHLLDPLEYLAADIDAVSGRSIVQRTIVCMDLVAKHGRSSGKHILCDQILADNDDHNARRTYVLLNTAVDHTILGDIHRLGEEAAGNISHKRMSLGVGKGLKLGAIDGIIFTDVDIIRILGNVQIRAIRDVREGLVCRGSHLYCFTVNLSFLISLLRPLTSNNVGSLLILHQIHGNHGKLLAGSTL